MEAMMENIFLSFLLLLFIFCCTAILDKAVIVRCAIYVVFTIHSQCNLEIPSSAVACKSTLCIYVCVLQQTVLVVDYM